MLALRCSRGKTTSDQSTQSLNRGRLTLERHQLAFERISRTVAVQGSLKGNAIGLNANALEANTSVKRVVRKHNGYYCGSVVKTTQAKESLERRTVFNV